MPTGPHVHMSSEVRDVFMSGASALPAEQALKLLDVHRVPLSQGFAPGTSASRRLVERLGEENSSSENRGYVGDLRSI